MMVLIAVFTLLFAGWVLWLWTVAEGSDIRWLRVLCAKLFVVIVFVMGAGAGIVGTRILLKSELRSEVRNFTVAVRQQLEDGEHAALIDQLNTVLERPDEWSGDSDDLLERMTAATQRMRDTRPDPADTSQLAERPVPIPRRN